MANRLVRLLGNFLDKFDILTTIPTPVKMSTNPES